MHSLLYTMIDREEERTTTLNYENIIFLLLLISRHGCVKIVGNCLDINPE